MGTIAFIDIDGTILYSLKSMEQQLNQKYINFVSVPILNSATKLKSNGAEEARPLATKQDFFRLYRRTGRQRW